MSTQTLVSHEVRMRGMKALVRELGPAGMVDFMQQFRGGHGDYTKERRKHLNGLTIDQIVDEIQRKQAKRR
jgi:hypothetical protein